MKTTSKLKKLDEKKFYIALNEYKKELRQSAKLRFTKIEEKFMNLATNKSNSRVKDLNEDLNNNKRQKKKLLNILIHTISNDDDCEAEEQKISSDYFSLSGSSSETSENRVGDSFYSDFFENGQPFEDEHIPVTEIDKWCKFSKNKAKKSPPKLKQKASQPPTRAIEQTEPHRPKNTSCRRKRNCKISSSGLEQSFSICKKNGIQLNQDSELTAKSVASERFLAKETTYSTVLKCNKESTTMKCKIMQTNAKLEIHSDGYMLNCQPIRRSARLKEKENFIADDILATNKMKCKVYPVKQKMQKEKSKLQSPLTETETSCKSVSVQSKKFDDVNVSYVRKIRERCNNVSEKQEQDLFAFPTVVRSSPENKQISLKSRTFKKKRKKKPWTFRKQKSTTASTVANPIVVSQQASVDESVVEKSFFNPKKRKKKHSVTDATSYIKDITEKTESSRYLILKSDCSIVVSNIKRKSGVLFVLPLGVEKRSNYYALHEVPKSLDLEMCSNFCESSQSNLHEFLQNSITHNQPIDYQTESESPTTAEMLDERMHTNVQSIQMCNTVNTAAPIKMAAESQLLTQTKMTNNHQISSNNSFQYSIPSYFNLSVIAEEDIGITESNEVELERECLYADKVDDSLSQTQKLNEKMGKKTQTQPNLFTRMEAPDSYCTQKSNNLYSNSCDIPQNKSTLLPDKPLKNLINFRKKVCKSSTGKDMKKPNLSKSTDLPSLSNKYRSSKSKRNFENLKPHLPSRGYLKSFQVDKCSLQSESYEPQCKIFRDGSSRNSSEVTEFKVPFPISDKSVARYPLESSKDRFTATQSSCDSIAPTESSCIDYSFFVEDEHISENSVISDGSFSLYSKTLREMKEKYRKQDHGKEIGSKSLGHSLLSSYMSFVNHSQLNETSTFHSTKRSAIHSNLSQSRGENASNLKANLWLKSMLSSSELESKGAFKW